MKNNRMIITISFFLLIVLTGACSNQQQVVEATEDNTLSEVLETATPVIPAPEEAQPTADLEDTSADAATQRYTFDQLGISLEIPSELYVSKDPLVSYDDPSILDGYLFYIQNYGYPGGPSSGNFQMYGHLQYNLVPISWEVFAGNIINSTMNAYANEIEINGLRGFDTQLSGQRNRFVYQFLLNGQVLSIAVSDITEENKAAADQIISTLQFNPEEFTRESRVQKLLDPNFLYQLYIPDDWTFNFGTPAGIRLSDFEASSPNAEILVEETEGPHSNIYYKNGIFMNVVVLEDDSANYEPNSAQISRSFEVMYAGIEGTDYTFVEPSTAEGELRELRFYYEGKSFLIRFAYTSDVDQQLLDWLILNLIITPQSDS